MTSRWRVRELVGEAARNLRAAPVASLLLVAVIAVAACGGTLLDASEARRARVELADRARNGGWVTVARAPHGIDAGACRHLAHQPDVLAAGGVGKPRSLAVSSAPGTLFEAYDATPELIDVLVAQSRPVARAGVVAVGAALAAELGLVDGSSISLPARGQYSVVVLPRSARAVRFSRALIIPEWAERVEECWVEWVPGTAEVRSLTESLLAVDAPLTVSATLTSGSSMTDPFTRYAERWTRWWSVLVGAIGVLVFAVTLRARGRARALYAAVGSSRCEVAALVALEVLGLAVLGSAAGASWGLAVFARGGEVTSSDVTAALWPTSFVPACAVLVTVLALVARRGNVANELKAE